MVALHSLAAHADEFYVRYNQGYELVHRNTGRVDVNHKDIIAFCNSLRTIKEFPQPRISNLIRNKRYEC